MISDNLIRVFPKKKPNEIVELRNKFYIQLSRIFAEMMYAYTYPDEISKRVSYENFEEINSILQEGRSVLLCGGHFYNWEWLGMNLAKASPYPIYGIYKPLSNKYFDKYLKEARSILGVNLISMRETKRLLEFKIKNKEAGMYALASDQSPSYIKKSVWVDFFGINTPFYPGLEYFSSTYDLPAFMMSVSCPSKGIYVARARRIIVNNNSITQAYAKALEIDILADPVSWLWSHNRWKHIKE